MLCAAAPGLARALVPRSVTVALALPIAERLGAPAPVVAACVVLTGLLGANLAQANTHITRFIRLKALKGKTAKHMWQSPVMSKHCQKH